jgi:hypothetical protein
MKLAYLMPQLVFPTPIIAAVHSSVQKFESAQCFTSPSRGSRELTGGGGVNLYPAARTFPSRENQGLFPAIQSFS